MSAESKAGEEGESSTWEVRVEVLDELSHLSEHDVPMPLLVRVVPVVASPLRAIEAEEEGGESVKENDETRRTRAEATEAEVELTDEARRRIGQGSDPSGIPPPARKHRRSSSVPSRTRGRTERNEKGRKVSSTR